MNDRQFLQSLLKICAMNIQNEEFEQMYIMIFEHLNPPRMRGNGAGRYPSSELRTPIIYTVLSINSSKYSSCLK